MYSGLIDYSFLNEQHGTNNNRRCIDGHVTGCNKCVGYCNFDEHPGFLTNKLRTKHKCIEKGCHYYLAKPAVTRERNTNKGRQDLLILESASKALSEREGIKPIRVKSDGSTYVVQFITITNLLGLDNTAKKLSQDFGVNIRFERLMYDFDKCVSLIMTS